MSSARAPAPLAAAHAQLDRLWHVSNLYSTEPMQELSLKLSDVFGESSGTARGGTCAARPFVARVEPLLHRADAGALAEAVGCLRRELRHRSRRHMRSSTVCGTCRTSTPPSRCRSSR